jgi:hypothetical protein
LIFGIAGALRRDELVKMKLSDVEDKGSILIVKVPDSKTHSERMFTVSNEDNIRFIRKYQSLRPSNASSERLFLKYAKGKCFNQNVGINKIGEIPSLIAKCLKKENPKEYTGHCFRRSSATLLANAGGDITLIKRHGGWKSSNVAEGYIEDCINNKIAISNKIQPSAKTISEPSTSTCNLKPLNKSGNKTDNISNLVKPSMSANSFNNGISKLQGSLESGIISGSNFSACNFNFYISK